MSVFQRKNRIPLLGGLLLGLALAATPGCGTGPGPRAEVKGKVLFNNQIVPIGTVGFFGPNNRAASANIQSDGTYVIPDAPVGEVTITVTTPKVPEGRLDMKGPPPGVGEMKPPGEPGENPGAKGPAAPDMSKFIPVPQKYQDKSTSTLKYTVTNGSQEYDIKITP
jgi:hypothetical protein